jgi:hypothetical protein
MTSTTTTSEPSKLDSEIKEAECKLQQTSFDKVHLSNRLKQLKSRKQKEEREQRLSKGIPYGMSEEEFQICMGWHGSEYTNPSYIRFS